MTTDPEGTGRCLGHDPLALPAARRPSRPESTGLVCRPVPDRGGADGSPSGGDAVVLSSQLARGTSAERMLTGRRRVAGMRGRRLPSNHPDDRIALAKPRE